MDVDPLSDRQPPPRHAIESDSEDEDAGEYPHGPPKKSPRIPTLTVRNLESLLKGTKLLVVIGEAARNWRMLYKTDTSAWTQPHPLTLDDDEVGSLWQNSKQDLSILFCDKSSRLSLLAYRSFAESVLGLEPSRIAVLDSYPITAYTGPLSTETDPSHTLRFLSTGPAPSFKSKITLHPFSPPNLLTSPGAAILSLSSLIRRTDVLAVLLPGQHIPRLADASRGSGYVPPEEWEPSLVQRAMDAVWFHLEIDGRGVGIGTNDISASEHASSTTKAKQQSQVGEGGMYI